MKYGMADVTYCRLPNYITMYFKYENELRELINEKY